ncbi:MAG: hypothetical protein ACYCQL_11710, partial [Acidithiobacillus sp.]
MMNKTTQRRPCPQGWPHGRGISGRMPVERVAGSPWNRWPDAAGIRRRGSLTFQQVQSLQGEAEDLLAGAEYEVDSLSVLELVRDSEC